MSSDEIIGMAIFFGSIVSVVFIIMVGSIIKQWLKRGTAPTVSENPEFLSALREFKENMERRMSNLEEIVLQDEISPKKAIKSESHSIELEMKGERDASVEGKPTNLRNMLSH